MLSDNDLENSKVEDAPPKKEPQLNPVKKRYLILSPPVAHGLEREANKNDFEALDDKYLGKGGFGCVWKVRHKITRKIYAIKVIDKTNIIKENLVEQTNREIDVMYHLDHPHIIKLYNHFEDDDTFCLIMQYAPKGHLYKLIKGNKPLDQKTAAQYVREVISAVKYLHTRNPPIIHRDIKPENVLLDADMRCKLADFGWSNEKVADKDRETFCGTPEYLAPEMIKKTGHNESVDIWAIGVLLFELLTGKTPFNANNDKNALYTAIRKIKINWPDDLDPLAKDLIGKILREDPSKRLSLDQILEHSWFQKQPIIKQVLPPYNYTQYEKLCSHMIHSLPEHKKSHKKNNTSNISNNIKTSNTEQDPTSNSNMRGSKRTKITNQNAINLKSTDIGGFQQQEKSTPKTNNNEDIKMEENNNTKVGDKIAHQKVLREVEILKEEIKNKNKEIEMLKGRLDQSGNDSSALYARNKERESMLNELENKQSKVLDLESKLNLTLVDMEQLKKESSEFKQQKEELKTKIQELEKQNRELENQMAKSEQEKKEEIDYLQSKLTKYEEDYVGEASKSYDVDKIMKVSYDYLRDIKDYTEQKFENIKQKMLEKEQKEIEDRKGYELSIESKLKNLVEDFKKDQAEFFKVEAELIQKQLDEEKDKNRELMNKIKQYKALEKEFNQYKAKLSELKAKEGDTDERIRLYLEEKNVVEEKNEFLMNLNNKKDQELANFRKARDIYKQCYLAAEQLYCCSNKEKMEEFHNKTGFPSLHEFYDPA